MAKAIPPDGTHPLLPWRPDGHVSDLSFDEHWRPYATHALHPFAAKFPPPLARWAIEQFTDSDEWVLDPFAGSGTALVESRLLGRNALAAEIDPLSRLISRVKATPVDPSLVDEAQRRVVEIWSGYCQIQQGVPALESLTLPDFPRRDYWFRPEVQRDLVLLRDAIATIEDTAVREFLLVVYSSVIVAKGPSSVANALDIAHSRAHHFEHPKPPDVWARYRERYRRALLGLQELHATANRTVSTLVGGQDARQLPYGSQVADFVLSSPPYVTAIEYPRGHKFSLWWIGDLLGVSHRIYEQLGPEYIGTHSVPRKARAVLRTSTMGLPTPDQITATLDELDAVRAGRARQYFLDMRLALMEMLRTLRPERYAVLVVADSTLRGLTVPTGDCLTEIAESLEVDGGRFVHRDTLLRTIRERSRQMPIKRGNNAGAMNTEQVLVLQRLPARHLFPVERLNGQPLRSAQLSDRPAI